MTSCLWREPVPVSFLPLLVLCSLCVAGEGRMVAKARLGMREGRRVRGTLRQDLSDLRLLPCTQTGLTAL